ncbi:hypothetical protein HK405_000662 [Cladochytrium tenue]|nr:hypothetical protein HK405_000662 [Cladochytrium tenue]
MFANYLGVERSIGNLTWGNATGFTTELPSTPNWKPENSTNPPVGYIVPSDRGLTYIRVAGAGRMVPMDAPEAGIGILRVLLSLPSTYKPPSPTGTPGTASFVLTSTTATATGTTSTHSAALDGVSGRRGWAVLIAAFIALLIGCYTF